MKVNYEGFQFDERDGLQYNGIPVADFNLQVVAKKDSLGFSKARGAPAYQVEAVYTDGRPPQHEWTDSLKNMDLFALFEIDDSFLTAENRKLLLSKLMHEAGRLHWQTEVESREGLQGVCKTQVYVFGEYVLCYGELPDRHKVITQHSISPIRYTDGKELLKMSGEYIKLLPGVSEILFFGAFFAVVKPFLSRLSIPCGFLLSFVAPSGHLKTTLARMYALWMEPQSVQEANFCSLQRDQSILNAIDSLSGQNFLLDDLHEITNTNEKRRQERRLDIVARHVDEKPACANVILTGETMEKMGIFSCMDRVFQVRIPKMDAVGIERLKEKVSALPPGFMPSMAYAFARSLTGHYPEVLKEIQEFYHKNSINHAATGYATRMHRHALFIRMAAYLFAKYIADPELVILKNETELDSAIQKQIDLQQAELQKIRETEEPCDYIVEFYKVIGEGDRYIKVCSNPQDYNDSENSCLQWKEKIYITTGALKKCLFKRFQKYVPVKLVVDAFHKEGILEEEPGSKGRQKNFQNQKHYVINLCYFFNYLHRIGCPVNEDDYERYVKRYL